MKLGGWARLWVVASALYGALVVSIASSEYPQEEALQSTWFSEASETIATAISKAEGVEVPAYRVREKFLSKSPPENANWLERVATDPSEKQKVFSQAVLPINKKYQAALVDLPRSQLLHWVYALAYWLGGSALLFGAGWCVGWVYRGFRQSAA